MKTDLLLQRLVAVGPDFINTLVKPGPHCVLASAIGSMALAEGFGIVAEPYPVAVNICNQAWVDWCEDHYRGGPDEQRRRGAYLLSNVPDFRGRSFMTVKIAKPWDGHLVLRVPDGQTEWLVDLDLGSFNRPQHQIVLPGGLVAPLSPGGYVRGTFTDDTIRTTVEYGPLKAVYANDYQQARDWAGRDRFAGHVKELIQALGG